MSSASWQLLQFVAAAQATAAGEQAGGLGAVGVPVGGRGGGDAVAGEGGRQPLPWTLVDAPAAPVAYAPLWHSAQNTPTACSRRVALLTRRVVTDGAGEGVAGGEALVDGLVVDGGDGLDHVRRSGRPGR